VRPSSADWQNCQCGDTNVNSSETSGIMKLSPVKSRMMTELVPAIREALAGHVFISDQSGRSVPLTPRRARPCRRISVISRFAGARGAVSMIQGATLSAARPRPFAVRKCTHASAPNSVSGTANTATPQSRQTKTSGKTQTRGSCGDSSWPRMMV
jgi:hypothetical protein